MGSLQGAQVLDLELQDPVTLPRLQWLNHQASHASQAKGTSAHGLSRWCFHRNRKLPRLPKWWNAVLFHYLGVDALGPVGGTAIIPVEWGNLEGGGPWCFP